MGYNINGKEYGYDSIVNQRIKDDFVRRNVYRCVTSIVEYILNKSWEDRDAPFCHDDVLHFYVPRCPECHTENDMEESELYLCVNCYEKSDEPFEYCIECDSEDSYELFIGYKCGWCGHLAEGIDIDTVQQEVYEWWIVSDWLLSKFGANGEVVIQHENIWGRTCTGQAISLDSVISQICYDMRILEGQQNEWKVA